MSISRLPAPARLAIAALLSCASIAAVPALAQDATAPDPNSVVVTVGDVPITEAEIGFAAEDLGQDLANIPANQRRAFLVSVLIDMKVMAEAARAADLDKSEVFKKRLTYLEDRSLRRAYFAEKVSGTVTGAAVQTAYDTFVAGFEPQEEVRARHILVSSEDDAKAVKAEIDAGKPFEIAALEKSQDGSAQNGGDLGYFTSGMMVKPFEEAAFALDVGEVSEPIQTQYGWHIIKLEDRRMSSPPPLAQVSSQIQQQLMIKAFTTEMDRLKQNVEVSFTDPALEAQVKAEAAAALQSEEQ